MKLISYKIWSNKKIKYLKNVLAEEGFNILSCLGKFQVFINKRSKGSSFKIKNLIC